MFVFALFLSIGCNTPQQMCKNDCESDREFLNACYDQMLEQGVGLTCYNDLDALGESLAGAGVDVEARAEVLESWFDEAKSYVCETVDDVITNCIDLKNAESVHLSGESADALGEYCVEPDADDIETAKANKDCDAFLTAIGF